MTTAVYMDHNATTPVRPEAAQAVRDVLCSVGNPSSVHGPGREARRCLEAAREAVAHLVGAAPADLVLTGGGTEANDLAINGAARPRVLVSAVEHDSVGRARPDAEQIPVDGDGRVDPDQVARMLAADGRPALVSVMLANNETGVLQPVARIAEVARAAGALVHCDAIQAVGKVPVNLHDLGVDLLTVSSHKIGGPMGAGALAARPGLELAARLRGGGQERGRRAGTEALPALAGFGAAARVMAESPAPLAGLAALRDRLEAGVRARSNLARIIGAAADRLPNTTCVTMPGVSSETQVMALDLAGVAVSAGSACSSGKVTASRVLEAMGVAWNEAATAIRVSLGWTTRDTDIDAFLDAWGDVFDRLGADGLTAAPA